MVTKVLSLNFGKEKKAKISPFYFFKETDVKDPSVWEAHQKLPEYCDLS